LRHVERFWEVEEEQAGEVNKANDLDYRKRGDMSSAAEKPKLLLVDFENVQQVELKELSEDYRVVIFVGSGQKSVPIDLVTGAQKLGSRIEWQRVGGEGRNALDFFIACHLGRVMDKTPRPECIVLSKDKGFDPLLKHLTADGLKCRRINSLGELRHVAAPALAPAETNVRRVVELLGKLEKRERPRKRRTLAQSISAMFQKRLTRQEVDHIITTLHTNRMISETNGIITYDF
jgi:hypothetical protein